MINYIEVYNFIVLMGSFIFGFGIGFAIAYFLKLLLEETKKK